MLNAPEILKMKMENNFSMEKERLSSERFALISHFSTCVFGGIFISESLFFYNMLHLI